MGGYFFSENSVVQRRRRSSSKRNKDTRVENQGLPSDSFAHRELTTLEGLNSFEVRQSRRLVDITILAESMSTLKKTRSCISLISTM